MTQLSLLISPSPLGVVPRLLAEPLSGNNLAVQLHVLQLLQQLFDAPRPILELLLQPQAPGSSQPPHQSAAEPQQLPWTLSLNPAAFYTRHHLHEAARLYHAADGDASSACAELCHLHLRLLHSLVRSGVPAVLAAAHRERVVDLLMGELALQLEAQEALLAAAGDEGAEQEEDELREGSEQDSDDGEGQQGASDPLPKPPPTTGFTGKFEFCYDLNEDLQRIMDLEDQLGEGQGGRLRGAGGRR